MKRFKFYIIFLVGVFGIAVSCKDDSIVSIPNWESAVHADVAVAGEANFKYKSSDPITLDYYWNSIDSKLTVVKIDFYVQFNEPYIDSEGNPKVAKIGGEEGKLLRTLEGSAIGANRTKFKVAVTQDQIYALYKDATFDYDGSSTDSDGDGKCDKGCNAPVAVFKNPATIADRIEGGRFIEADEFKLLWRLTTNDGRVFKSWGVSVCTEFPNASCDYNWVVVCPYPGINFFSGAYKCTEPGYGTYDVGITLKSGSQTTIVVDNFWDAGAVIEYVIDAAKGTISIPEQSFKLGANTYTVTGAGEINNCNGSMVVPYVVKQGATTVDTNTHTFKK